jgi:hypothetical protein
MKKILHHLLPLVVETLSLTMTIIPCATSAQEMILSSMTF